MSLPDPVKAPLGKSPLQLVVCQVRFEETLAVSDAKLVLRLHGDLGGRAGRYPKLESVRGDARRDTHGRGGPARSTKRSRLRGMAHVLGGRLDRDNHAR